MQVSSFKHYIAVHVQTNKYVMPFSLATCKRERDSNLEFCATD